MLQHELAAKLKKIHLLRRIQRIHIRVYGNSGCFQISEPRTTLGIRLHNTHRIDPGIVFIENISGIQHGIAADTAKCNVDLAHKNCLLFT